MGQSTCVDLVVKSERHPVDREFPNCKKVDRGKSPKSGAARGAVGSRMLRDSKGEAILERRNLDNPYLRLDDPRSVGWRRIQTVEPSGSQCEHAKRIVGRCCRVQRSNEVQIRTTPPCGGGGGGASQVF
jgi:hypothetical protein